MTDWLSSMQQTFEYYTVDPGTWKDDKKLDNVKSCTISRDLGTETLGSATIEVTESDDSEKDAEIERLKADNEMLKKKYIDRFLGDVDEETEKIDEEKIDEPEEKEVIDIKEI